MQSFGKQLRTVKLKKQILSMAKPVVFTKYSSAPPNFLLLFFFFSSELGAKNPEVTGDEQPISSLHPWEEP